MFKSLSQKRTICVLIFLLLNDNYYCLILKDKNMAEYSQDNYGNYYRDGEQISSSEYHHAKAQYDAQSASNIKNLLIAAAAIAFIYVLVVWTVTIVVCILIFFPVIIALIKGFSENLFLIY